MMIQIIKSILLALTLLVCPALISSEPASPPSWSSSAMLETPHIYHSVNVITGAYCEAQTDLTLSASKEQVRRAYHSGDALAQWNFSFSLTTPSDPASAVRCRYDAVHHVAHVESPGNSPLFYHFDPAHPLLLQKVERGDQLCVEYRYTPHSQKGTPLLTERHQLEGRFLLNEYDAQGRVMVQKAPLGTDGRAEVMHRFIYGKDFTEVYDALGHKVIYRYSAAQQHLTAIEHYTDDGRLYRVEQLIWDEATTPPRLQCRAFADGTGTFWTCTLYRYNERDQLVEEALYGNLTGECPAELKLQPNGIPVENGIERYATTYSYETVAPYRLLCQTEDNGHTTHYRYAKKNGPPNTKLIGKGDVLTLRHFYRYDEQEHLVEAITDDGTAWECDNLTGITERRTTLYRVRQQVPAQGLPDQIEEYLETPPNGQRQLLKRTQYDYSAAGRVLKEETTSGAGEPVTTHTYHYDAWGRCISTAGPEGKAIDTLYDRNGNVIRRDQSHFSYDYSNRIIRSEQTSPEENPLIFHYQYDLASHKTAVTDPCGNTTHYRYDPFGRVIKTTYPAVLNATDQSLCPTEERGYDISNNLILKIDAEGNATKTRYNARNKPVEICYPDNTREYFVYNLDGTLQRAIAKDDMSEQYHYDLFARVLRVERYDAQGQLHSITTSTYNAFRRLSTTDPTGKISSDTPLIAPTPRIAPPPPPIEHPPKATTHTAPYANSRGQYVWQTTNVEPNGCTTITIFDALQRVETIVIQDAMGQPLSHQEMRYTLTGQKAREAHLQADDKAKNPYVMEWTYGPAGRLEAIAEAVGTTLQSTTRYLYDGYGRLQQLIKPDGIALDYVYNAMGELKRLVASDHSIDYTYSYDLLHRVVAVSDGVYGGCTTRLYNKAGQLAMEMLSSGLNLAYEYDAAGLRKQLILPDGSGVEYHYVDGRLSTLHRLSPQQQRLYSHHTHYNASGKVTHMQLAGMSGTINYGYDSLQRRTTIRSPYWSAEVPAGGYDAKGNLTHIQVQDVAGSFSETFSYDDRCQLIREESPQASHTYGYDALYNRTSHNGTSLLYDARQRLIRNKQEQYTYNINGCLTSKHTRHKITTAYHYDALNRLTKMQCPNYTLTFTYDAFGRRMTKTVQNGAKSTTLRYLYDGEEEIGTVASDGSLKALRVTGGATTAAIEVDDRVFAPIYDLKGSLCCLIDIHTQTAVESYRYSAFGATQIFNAQGTPIPHSQIANPWRFAGKHYDDETDLYYFGKRYYDPSLGRWITPDPLSFVST